MRLATLSIVLLALLTTGCKHPGDHDPAPAERTSAAHAILDFARVADEGETTVSTLTYAGREVRLAEVRRFKIARAYLSQDDRGSPALGFDLADVDKQAFSDWTASMIGKVLVVLIDGEVEMMATVRSRLPGGGILQFGGKLKSAAEMQALAKQVVERP